MRGQIAYEHRHRYAVCLEFARDNDVLDIACGEGYGSSLLAPIARSVTGVDIDEVSIRHAAARYTATNLVFRTGSATEIPLPDASIDVVVSFETIEHLDDHRTMLSEIVRVLRPDGRLVISSPNKRVYSDLPGVANTFHVRELYFDEFRDLLRDFFPRIRLFGQRIVGVSAVHPLHGAADGTGWLDATGGRSAGIGALPDPEYFIGICGRDPSDDLSDVSSVFLDPADDLLLDIRGGGLAAAQLRETPMHVNGSGPVAHNGTAAGARDEAAQAAARRVLELQEELLVARETFSERIASVETERDEARLELIAAANERREALERASLLGAERDAMIAESSAARERTKVLEAELSAALVESSERVEELRAHAATLERERDHARAELGTLVADLRSERDRLEARIHALEAEREAASAAIAVLETERERTIASNAMREAAVAEREAERARAFAAIEAERDAALAEVAAERTRFDAVRTRIATLERARERLYDRGAQVEKERDEARAATATLRDRLREAKRLQSNTAAEVTRAQERLARAVEAAERHRAVSEELASHAALLENAARRSGSVVRDLGAAQARAAAAIAALELTRRRLEFALTSRVAASDGKAARNASLAGRLREQIAVLTEALALRERHIAALETTMREREAQLAEARQAAEEDDAAAAAADIEAQIEFYRAMNARIRSSKLWKLRTKVRSAIGRPAD